MPTRYFVSSEHSEDIAAGRVFEPGVWAVGVDPANPYDQAKIAAGRLIPDRSDAPKATPAAAARAAELGVDLSAVAGTGAGDQIKVSDVESAAQPNPNKEESQ